MNSNINWPQTEREQMFCKISVCEEYQDPLTYIENMYMLAKMRIMIYDQDTVIPRIFSPLGNLTSLREAPEKTAIVVANWKKKSSVT